MHLLPILGRTFFLILIFNSLLTIAYGASLFFLIGNFFPNGESFYPLLLYGNIFWFLVAAGLLNIAPSIGLSQNFKTGRFLFHHYVYGFFVIITAYIYLALVPFNVASVFWTYDTRFSVNLGRILLLAGASMVADDIKDVHPWIGSFVEWIKPRFNYTSKVLSVLFSLVSVVCLYTVVILFVGFWQYPSWFNLANCILLGNIIVTCTVSLAFLARNLRLNSVNRSVDVRS